MIMQELENLSIEQLIELKEKIEKDIQKKKVSKRTEALKELKAVWAKFRHDFPNDTFYVTHEDVDMDVDLDIDLYELIDTYGFR